jgi:hypothetical protein
MAPAQPPFPPCLNFPFQPAAGSQTSNLISESEVGLAVPFTTQRAGAMMVGAFARKGPGTANGPSGIMAEEVMVV